MKMHDLGDPYPTTAPTRRTKPERYYPSVDIEDAPDLKGRVGQKVKIVGRGVIESHLTTERKGKSTSRCTLKLHSIGIVAGGGGKKSHVCGSCGKLGKAGYCSCGTRMEKL